jgi:hypothetical protein
MTTSHKRHRYVGGKHVLSTDGTVTFGALLDALVRAFGLNRHTSSAFVAMKKVLAQTFTKATDTTIVAVVYRLTGIIAP